MADRQSRPEQSSRRGFLFRSKCGTALVAEQAQDEEPDKNKFKIVNSKLKIELAG
jgi:hypothetical protein